MVPRNLLGNDAFADAFIFLLSQSDLSSEYIGQISFCLFYINYNISIIIVKRILLFL